MEAILEDLARAPGVQACMVVGRDGLVVAQTGETSSDVDLVGATAAEIFTGADSAVEDRLGRGLLGIVSLEASAGSMFLRAIDEVMFLLVLAEDHPNLGLVRYEIRRAADRLRESL